MGGGADRLVPRGSARGEDDGGQRRARGAPHATRGRRGRPRGGEPERTDGGYGDDILNADTYTHETRG